MDDFTEDNDNSTRTWYSLSILALVFVVKSLLLKLASYLMKGLIVFNKMFLTHLLKTKKKGVRKK